MMPPARRSRFIAPHFVEIAGGADIPGPVWRACAFTTAAPGWPRDAEGGSHLHRCLLTMDAADHREAGTVHWRTESRPLVTSSGPAAPVVAEGAAADLMQAITAALGAAHATQPLAAQPPAGPAPGATRCIAPGFVEIQREYGLPGIWVCSQLSAAGPVSAARPWTHLQTAYIRERRSEGRSRYLCELESLPFAAVMPAAGDLLSPAAMPRRRPRRAPLHWQAGSLVMAMRSCLGRMFTPRPGEDEGLDLGGPAQGRA
jgi:hypothetical protein